jgi:LysR family transcriptional regulator, low CO2-responsive transcriptional regulator
MNPVHTTQNTLDSRQINAFVTLARTGSFTETGRELFLTHSAISHSVRALENELGCRLLNRLGKRIELTPVGESFLHYAKNGLRNFSEARKAVLEFKEWGSQRLRIGAGAVLYQRLLPLLLARLKAQFPNLLLTAKIVRPSEITASLKTGELEILLGSQVRVAPEIEFTPLFDSPLEIVVSSTHRWAARRHAPANELAKEPCLLPDKFHPTRQLIDRYFAADNIVINGIADIESLDVIKEMLRHGFGMSILPEWMIRDELEAGILAAFPVGRRHLRQSWGMLRLRGRQVTSVENAFQVMCAEAFKSLQSANREHASI